MKSYCCFFQVLVLLFTSHISATPYCDKHFQEILAIRSGATGSLARAIRLNGGTGSIVVTADDCAKYELQDKKTYSDFSKTFRRFINNYNKNGKLKASGHLYQGLSNLSQSFLELYNNCINNHKNYYSVFQRGKIHFDLGNHEQCLNDIIFLMDAKVPLDFLEEDFKASELLITKGQSFLEIGDYERAIDALSKAIDEDPTNKEIYFHRAAAYFEAGDFDLALKDYLVSGNDKHASFTASQEFTQELLKSAFLGASDAAIDFIPSMCSSIYGLSETFWAIHYHPIDSAQNFANACYEIVECVVDYCKTHDLENSIDECVEEVKILYTNFDQLTDREKGQLIGYAVGKYGVDVFAGGATLKAISAYNNLKNANRLCNLGSLAISSSNKEAVVFSALKHHNARTKFFENVKIHWGRQNKHFRDSKNFTPNRGTINISRQRLEKLISEKAGTGQKVFGEELFSPGYKERIDFKEVIGEFAKLENGTVTHIPTTKGIIRYGKDGAHVVPSDPGAIIK